MRINSSLSQIAVDHRPAAVSQVSALDYTSEDLRVDVERAQRAWKKYRKSRRRDGVIKLLATIFDIVAVWQRVQDSERILQRVPYGSADFRPRNEPYSALLTMAAHPKKIDRRTLAKWSRVLRLADYEKPPAVSLARFVRKRNGINACAALYTRRDGRQVIIAVEDSALADLLCRRLRSTVGELGRRFELQTSKSGSAEIAAIQDLFPMPRAVLRPAQAS